ncbi:MAG: carboxylesterase/lipase family protein [Candidatus Dormibacteria bacterium]
MTVTNRTSVVDRPVVATRKGTVRGVTEDGIARFLGIPFAAPPYGALRFALPQEHACWEGERDASTFGPTPPQTVYANGIERLMRSVQVEGDDILHLNIWTPQAALEGARLPVIVWIYGGALIMGSNAVQLYDGSSFARDDAVFVAINYRVGVEGFAELDDAPSNRGLADAIAALEWVRDEVAAFGGDPTNVTIAGQSAGGLVVAMLLASPRAEGLFHRAMIMSAAMGPAREPEVDMGTAVAQHLGIPRTREAFSTRTPMELAAAQSAVMAGGNAVSGGRYYVPVPGDELLPVNLWEAFQSGMSADIPVIIGTTRDEHRFWYVSTALEQFITPEVVTAALGWMGVLPDAYQLYQRNRPGQSAAMVYGALSLDWVTRVGLNAYADVRVAQGARTWVYEFAWESPVMGLGAAHVVDLPFLFDHLAIEDATMLVGADAPQQVADDMHGALVRFAKHGEADWEQWNASRPVMTFDAPTSTVVHAPREEERLALTPGRMA